MWLHVIASGIPHLGVCIFCLIYSALPSALMSVGPGLCSATFSGVILVGTLQVWHVQYYFSHMCGIYACVSFVRERARCIPGTPPELQARVLLMHSGMCALGHSCYTYVCTA